MRTPTNPTPHKQNKVPLITKPNPNNNIYHLNDPNTKVPITNPPPNKNKKRNNKEPIH